MGKTRSKLGKKTFGQCGDIQATNPIGQPLMDLCSIELKRGYKGASIADVLDARKGYAKQMWQSFLEQVLIDHVNAGAPYWLLITKRDRREALVFMPWEMCDRLRRETRSKIGGGLPHIRTCLRLKSKERILIFGMHLQKFLDRVSPDNIRELQNRHKTEKK